uniref:Uncharacterized protein n=1 Tax=Anguilla anguilla TaxID=7936 RepID=A0A0E9P5R9_ANGAN
MRTLIASRPLFNMGASSF